MSKLIKALIHVRAGSERVKNKNIKPFANSNLLEIKIRQLLRIKQLDGIIVNTESDEMLDIAKALGAEGVKRDAYYASSTVPMNEVHRNMAENFNADIVMCTPVTNPLIADSTIEHAIDLFKNLDNQFDSVNTGYILKEFMWYNNKPYNYNPQQLPKSQNLPNIIVPNFAVNIISKENWLKYEYVLGKNPKFLIVNKIEAIDIDDEIDFEFAEFMYRKYIHAKELV